MSKNKKKYSLKKRVGKFFKHKTKNEKFHSFLAYLGHLYIKFVGLTSRIQYSNFKKS